MHIRWQSYTLDTEVLSKEDLLSIEELTTYSGLRWSGYGVPLCEERIPKQHFYTKPVLGGRLNHILKKRYKDSVRGTLKTRIFC